MTEFEELTGFAAVDVGPEPVEATGSVAVTEGPMVEAGGNDGGPTGAPRSEGDHGRKTPVWAWFVAAALVVAVAVAAGSVWQWTATSGELDETETLLADARDTAADLEKDLAAARDAKATADERADEAESVLTDLESRLVDFVVKSGELEGSPPQLTRCMLDELGVRDFVATMSFLAVGEELPADLAGRLASTTVTCGEFGPQGPGDDPALDALHLSCAGGDGGACDALYLTAPAGSDYEEYGLTCGHRFEPVLAPEVCAGAI